MDSLFKIIIIGDDLNSNLTAKTTINEIDEFDIELTTVNLAEGYDLVHKIRPHLAIINLHPTPEKALQLAEKISKSIHETTLFVTSSQNSPELMIQAMRVGAREFLLQPLNKYDLVKAVKLVLNQKKKNVVEHEYSGKIISVFGGKGGVGTTTIATNLAVMLAKNSKKRVLLIDLNLQMGNAAYFLNLKPDYSLYDVASKINDIDIHMLESTLPKHPSGLRLLAAPLRIEEAGSISDSQIEKVISYTKDIFDYIVLDTSTKFDDNTIKAFDCSDNVLLVTSLDVPALVNTKRCLDIFERMGFDNEKVKLVLNRYGSTNGVETDVIEKSIDYPIFWKVPNQNFSNVFSAINQGIPITLMMPRSKIAENFTELAQYLNGADQSHQLEPNPVPKKNIFKKVLKRN